MSQSKPMPSASESVKETVEHIIIAFILAFVFRAYVVEAFVIPTGSMAPTLLGRHVELTCHECGYRFTVDQPKAADRSSRLPRLNLSYGPNYQVQCPMCGARLVMMADMGPNQPGYYVRPGDRILVHKYIYSLTEPRRWDVVVFKNPTQPTENYIKRLVGKPNEQLWIIEGNVYLKDNLDLKSTWRIARKSERPDVQQAVWQPIYNSKYVPLDAQTRVPRWQPPWNPEDHSGNWDMAGRDAYRYNAAATGSLAFDFTHTTSWYDRQRPNLFTSRYAYNMSTEFELGGRGAMDAEPIEDVRLAMAVEPEQPDLGVTLETTGRVYLDDADKQNLDLPVRVIRARIDATGQATMYCLPGEDREPVVLDSMKIDPLPAGRSTQVELWFVDQEVSLWVAGERVLRWDFELPIKTLQNRIPLSPYYVPDLRIEVSGTPVKLHRVRVDRDLYYSSQPRSVSGDDVAILQKRAVVDPQTGRMQMQPIGPPLVIEKDQFFCLGDNSPRSLDGRHWGKPDRHIIERLMADANNVKGVVPRKLLVGRAFFVYWPTPLSTNPRQFGIFPNFEDMRFIH